MLKHIARQLPPIWLWFLTFSISIIWLFIFGFNPKNYLFKYWHYLFIYNIIIIIIATYYISKFIKTINQQKKYNIVGSKFTLSLAKIIPILTIIPVLSLYIFSFQSVQNNLQLATDSINRLNTVIYNEVDNIHQDLELFENQNYINISSKILKIIYQFIQDKEKYPQNLSAILNKLAVANNICKLSLLINNKNISSSLTKKNCEIWQDYKLSNELYSITKKKDKNTILIQLPLKSIINIKKNIILIAFYQKNIQLSNLVNKAYNFKKNIKNTNITLNTSIIKRKFLLDFSTTILLTLLSILIIVIKMVEKIMIPLNSLSIASKKISAGEYGTLAVNTSKDSDIKNLIAQFNQMSIQIKQAKIDIDDKNLYLEAVIKYSSGIIAIDNKYCINLINEKAIKLLALEKKQNFIGKNYQKIKQDNQQDNQQLVDFFNHLNISFTNEDNFHTNIKINDILLDCQSTILKNDNKIIGYIIIIKDISIITKTQKLIAWNEVAKKMAHEIKNPLNPILLSAQRLRNKFLYGNETDKNNIIDKTTKTIIAQVTSINYMVSSFAEYGTQPKQNYKKQNLNTIIKNTIALYEEEYEINTQFETLNNLKLDKNSMTRVLINLIKNSIESKKNDKKLKILITTKQRYKNIILTISDNGIGFDKNIINHVFDPYISSKKTGSGLGMAIVEKIIIQHNGLIKIDKNYSDGAKIIITFNIRNFV